MNILVRNLSRTTTSEDVKALFEPFGEILSCELIMDTNTGKSKGFGFVEMAKTGAARTAISALNGYELDGMRIRVKKGNPKPATSEDNREDANDSEQ